MQIDVPPLGSSGKAIMMGLNATKKPSEAATQSNFIANSAPTTGQQQLQSLYTRASVPTNVGADEGGGSFSVVA